MSSVDKMVMLPYDRYENLLSSAEEKINLKTYANVYRRQKMIFLRRTRRMKKQS